MAFYKLPVNGKSWGLRSNRLASSRCSCFLLSKRLFTFETTRQFPVACFAKRCVFFLFPAEADRGRGPGVTRGGAQEWRGAGSLWEEFKYSNSVYCFAVDAINVVLNFKEVIMPTWWHKEGTKQMPRKTGGGNDRAPVMGERTMGCEILKMAVTK